MDSSIIQPLSAMGMDAVLEEGLAQATGDDKNALRNALNSHLRVFFRIVAHCCRWLMVPTGPGFSKCITRSLSTWDWCQSASDCADVQGAMPLPSAGPI
jgi:hypothetical protein